MNPQNWPLHLRIVSDKLQGTNLISCDFEEVIDSLPKENLSDILEDQEDLSITYRRAGRRLKAETKNAVSSSFRLRKGLRLINR